MYVSVSVFTFGSLISFVAFAHEEA